MQTPMLMRTPARFPALNRPQDLDAAFDTYGIRATVDSKRFVVADSDRDRAIMFESDVRRLNRNVRFAAVA